MGFIDILGRLSSRLLLTDVLPQSTPHRFCSSSTPTVSESKPKHTNIPHIPIEIVISILEIASYPDAEVQDNRLLSNSALVCRDWSFISQRLLFRDVSLHTESDFEAFQTAVNRSTPKGCMLGDAVEHLHCDVDDRQPCGLSQEAFSQAVVMCPKLAKLSLALYGDRTQCQVDAPAVVERSVLPTSSLDESTLSMLRYAPQVTSLQFDNSTDNSEILSQLLEIWPNLTALAVSGIAPTISSPSSAPFPCSLEKLRVNCQASPSTGFLTWLLHNSTNTLRVLEFERDPSVEILERLVANHGASLESITLPSCASPERAALLAQCTQLRDMRIASAGTLPIVYRALPRTLEHLLIAVGKDVVLQPIVQAVKRSEALTKVTVHVCAGGEKHPQLAAMKIACAAKGIELNVTKDTRMLRSATHGSLVPAVFLPCAKPLKI